MASVLADSSVVYEADNDPDFVRLAAPSTLKTVEMLLSQSPRNEQLLLTACRGFTEYSYAFLHMEAEFRASDADAARDLRARAGQMYQRARGYCVRGLEARHPGFDIRQPDSVAKTTAADVPFLYWTAASWGAELSIAPNQFARLAELVSVRTVISRAKALQETWQDGAIYEVLIALDGLPALAGGSAAAAAADFNRARELSRGTSAFAFVAYAGTLTDPARKRALLEEALAIDVSRTPNRRLTNLIAQRYARAQLRVLTAAPR